MVWLGSWQRLLKKKTFQIECNVKKVAMPAAQREASIVESIRAQSIAEKIEVDLNGNKRLALKPVRSDVIEPMYGWAGEVKAGQYIRVLDPRGRQCADFWA